MIGNQKLVRNSQISKGRALNAISDQKGVCIGDKNRLKNKSILKLLLK